MKRKQKRTVGGWKDAHNVRRYSVCGMTNLTSREAGKCHETHRFGRTPMVSTTTTSQWGLKKQHVWRAYKYFYSILSRFSWVLFLFEGRAITDGRVFMVLVTTNTTCMSCLFIFFSIQPGVGLGDSDGQWGCSFHDGFVVLGGNVFENSQHNEICGRSAALAALWRVGQQLQEANGQRVLCFLVAPIPSVGHHDLALESFLHLVVNTSGFCQLHLMFAYQSYW